LLESAMPSDADILSPFRDRFNCACDHKKKGPPSGGPTHSLAI